jgi:hypothetical protein
VGTGSFAAAASTPVASKAAQYNAPWKHPRGELVNWQKSYFWKALQLGVMTPALNCVLLDSV